MLRRSRLTLVALLLLAGSGASTGCGLVTLVDKVSEGSGESDTHTGDDGTSGGSSNGSSSDDGSGSDSDNDDGWDDEESDSDDGWDDEDE